MNKLQYERVVNKATNLGCIIYLEMKLQLKFYLYLKVELILSKKAFCER